MALMALVGVMNVRMRGCQQSVFQVDRAIPLACPSDNPNEPISRRRSARAIQKNRLFALQPPVDIMQILFQMLGQTGFLREFLNFIQALGFKSLRAFSITKKTSSTLLFFRP